MELFSGYALQLGHAKKLANTFVMPARIA